MNTFKKFAYSAAAADALLGLVPPYNGTSVVTWICAAICLWMAVNSK